MENNIYIVHWQDFTGWREQSLERFPPVYERAFSSKAEANEFKRQQQAAGFVACVTEPAFRSAGRVRKSKGALRKDINTGR